MKARKIDLSPYSLGHIKLPDGTAPNYDVRGSLVELCFVPELQLTGTGLMTAHTVAQSIQNAPPSAVLLSEQDWSYLSGALQAHKGFGRNDVELVRRVLEAESIEVSEAAKASPFCVVKVDPEDQDTP